MLPRDIAVKLLALEQDMLSKSIKRMVVLLWAPAPKLEGSGQSDARHIYQPNA